VTANVILVELPYRVTYYHEFGQYVYVVDDVRVPEFEVVDVEPPVVTVVTQLYEFNIPAELFGLNTSLAPVASAGKFALYVLTSPESLRENADSSING
jgi:hypothetical protein